MGTISLTVPHKEEPLRRAAEMLTGLADDCFGALPLEVETPVVVAEVETPAPAGVPVYVMPEIAADKTPIDDGSGLDSKGLPWDGRIHASSQTTLAKTGAWKLKRGVSPEFVAQVEAELRAAQAATPVVTEAPVPPVTTEAPVVTEPVVEATVEVPAPPVLSETPVTFESICQKVTARANAELLKTTDIPGVLTPLGLSHIGELAARPDLFVTVNAALDTLWATTPV